MVRTAALALLLTACGQQDIAASIGGNNTAAGQRETDAEASQAIPKDTPNHEHDRLVAMRPGLRNVALTRAIEGAGGICNVVDRSYYQGMAKFMHTSIWSAHCTSGGNWRVSLDEDGDFRAMECSGSSVPCWEKLN
jgi:hypothetical protein